MPNLHDIDRLRLVIEGAPDVDREQLGALTTELRERLLEMRDIEDVERVEDPSSTRGGKAGDSFLPGVLVVVIPLGVTLLRQAFATIRTWIQHQPVVRVKLSCAKNGTGEIEVTGASRDVERELGRFLEHCGGQEGSVHGR